MGYRFNPPPNWPPPPPGWAPSPGWRPDPSWPPPPRGWQLWVWVPEEQPAGPPPAPSRPPATPSLWQRGRAWFARLPAWAKVVIVLLVLGLLPWLLIAAGLVLATVGIVGLVRGPLPRVKLTSRAAAVGALLAGVASLGVGSALAVAVLNPAPPPTTSPPVVAPATHTAPPTTASPPTTAPPPTTAAPATTRRPTTTAKKPATTHPPRSSAPASRPVSLCGAPKNPYGYNFCGRGGYVVDPEPDVCTYFDCIDNFWNGQGHMQECQDGTYSMSGGRPGSCSHHGGNLRPVYRGP
jgi:hypothetical protein